MKKARVYTEADGHVLIDHPNSTLQTENESDDAFMNRIGARAVEANPRLRNLPFVDVPQADILTLDRSQRFKWRVQGQRIQVDPSVPDPPSAKTALLARIDAATNIAALKTILSDMVTGR